MMSAMAGRRGVGDAPQGGQHVTVADQLQGPGQVERLVEQPQVAGGGLAGREVGQVGLAQVEGGKVGQGQRLVVQEEGAERGVGRVLDAVAGQVQPRVAGERLQDGLLGGGGAEQVRGVLGRGQVSRPRPGVRPGRRAGGWRRAA